jgi:hypothetical protein
MTMTMMMTLPTAVASSQKVRYPADMDMSLSVLLHQMPSHSTLLERKMVDGLRVFTYDELGISVNSGGMFPHAYATMAMSMLIV